ncbi:pentatricopeptide repeat-containing protein At4g19440, chloroplastic-like, partial [Ananas comosus]|uniref:Pentatricopeptide repeat-containing protein At4g19440, chloroplastic-like n=1 Tax=Ananas comosus TaxID=4615 RepID=A0A6P5EI88_ANACO
EKKGGDAASAGSEARSAGVHGEWRTGGGEAGCFRLRLRCFLLRDADADAEDEAAVEGFRERHAGSERVVYTERMVEDGEGTAGVMRGMSEKFDLVVVGRGGREDESGLTSGLSEWSECPELGVVGDMLASTDFGGKLSILVVQQQERLRSEHHHHTNGPQEEEVKNVLIHGPRNEVLNLVMHLLLQSENAHSAPIFRIVSADDDELRHDLAALLSRRDLDPALCRATLSRLPPRRLEALLLELRPALRPKPALRLFSLAADRLGFRFTPRSYALLLDSLLRSDPRAPAAPARLLLARLLDPVNGAPLLLLDGNDDPSRRFTELVRAIADTVPPQDAPFAASIDALVHVCCTQFRSYGQGLAVEALSILADRGLCPSLKVCNILLSSLARSNDLPNARQVFDGMQRFVAPDVYSYTPLIVVNCKNSEIDEAKRLFSEMERLGVLPSVVAYNALIDGLCKKGFLDEAFQFKEKMIKSSVEPSVVTFGILINGLVKLNQISDVGSVLKEMVGMGMEPNEVIYNTLIDWHCKMYQCAEALKLLDEMVSKGMEPNSVTYNSLAKGLCKAGEMEQAEYYFDEMLSNRMEIH